MRSAVRKLHQNLTIGPALDREMTLSALRFVPVRD